MVYTYEDIIVDEIYHHGIKGQRWGVRRFQRKDGSLTSAGKKRYSDDNIFSKSKNAVSENLEKQKLGHRALLEKKYKEKGMSEAEAQKAAAKRIKIETTIAITGAVTVAAATAWYARNRWVNEYCDQTLKAGTSFHNLDSAANYRPGEHLYVNYRQDDNNFFRGHFAVNKMKQTGHVFDHVVTANEDIKIPAMNTRKSVFKQLYDNDPEFRSAFHKNSMWGQVSSAAGVNSSPTKSAKRAYKKMWPRFGNKDDPAFNEAKRKYFEALRQKGYEAIPDEWDTNRKVFRSNAPLILLNNSSKSFGKMTISELTSKDILLAQANSKGWHTKTTLKNAASLPHTNHFKESAKQLTRFKTQSVKRSADIDKVLSRLTEGEVKSILNKRQGSIVSSAGKYMSKNGNMSVSDAMKKARKKHKITENVISGLSTSIMIAPIAASARIKNRAAVNKYLAEHPDTKKTTREIEQMLVEQRNKKRRR